MLDPEVWVATVAEKQYISRKRIIQRTKCCLGYKAPTTVILNPAVH